ncbi:3-hydroxyacyl-CoA dehydrogenase PaaC [Marinomonas rhizomae]|uniref:3-hydroxyacyl-CoA dehydrogenase n=1 Tax=Marinomonas rhizomae TaxID=491948 RepID=A0A366J8Y1_9GAMM|nr:3-hydroxyacyl-CoA dehydrogenase PaaH [Marinomonas rhizomae]RBP83486.1 3-hydroxyacyl-CoA dehydrogenase [Marinomonas rhizomae]RNF74037.1 3-hydroxyacyl-CoA dehydrogenase PaaC [Marinomonas rhizomae]
MSALKQNTVVGVIGAGAMGAGIAQVAAQAGHQVKLYDNREGVAQTAIDSMARQLAKLVERKKFTAGQVQQILARLEVANSLNDLADAGLVVEAIVEKIDVKKAIFDTLESVCSADCILASNTSSISITRLASGMKHPERMVGMHFFNPAPIMKLVEVVSGLATDSDVAACVYETALNWGKKPVYATSTPGFIVNRVARPFYAESFRLRQEQVADCATLDALLKGAGGFRMGAFELTDMIGHDVNYAVTCSVFDAYYGDFRFQPSLIQKDLVDAGFLGRKTGQGFYSYQEGAEKPEAQVVFVSSSMHAGTIQCEVSENVGHLAGLVERLSQAGVQVTQVSGLAKGYIRIGRALLALTDGRMACERAKDEQLSDLVLVDLALHYQSATNIALSRSASTSEETLNDVVQCLDLVGIKVSEVMDSPALVVMRTVAMLANESADAVLQGVATAEGVDTAMCFGVNYPKGPLAWADSIGIAYVERVLRHLHQSYGEDRYRPSLLMRRTAMLGESFHDQ